MPVVKALVYELLVRSYRNIHFRSVVCRLFPNREPLNWFFIAGCYNAGTTVVKDLVALHPDVATLPIEGDILSSHLSNYEDGGWLRCMYGNKAKIAIDRKTGSVDKRKLINDWSPWIKPGKYFLDKSISHACRLHHVKREFKDCRTIIVTRNPDSVVTGIQKRSHPTGTAREMLGEGTYASDLLYQQWAFLYSTMLKDTTESGTLIVSYELMLQEPSAHAARIYEFLGLSKQNIGFDRGVLTVGKQQLTIRVNSDTSDASLASRKDLEERIEDINEQYPAPTLPSKRVAS